jgi:hypothetical protein
VHEINELGDGLIIGPGNLFENGAQGLDAQALSALRVPTMLFSVSTGRIFDRTGRATRSIAVTIASESRGSNRRAASPATSGTLAARPQSTGRPRPSTRSGECQIPRRETEDERQRGAEEG